MLCVSNIAHYIEENYNISPPHIECFATIDSTNNYAKKLLSLKSKSNNTSLHYAIIASQKQTRGRGRLGRNFFSPKDCGVYFSIILIPPKTIQYSTFITAFASVAVVRAIKKTYNVDTKIKWINDIYIENKKVSGILTEGICLKGQSINSFVVGIGINIAPSNDTPSFLSNIKGEIITKDVLNKSYPNQIQQTKELKQNELIATVAGEFFNILDCIFSTSQTFAKEKLNSVIQEYKNANFLVGSTVTVHPITENIQDNSLDYKAQVQGISDNLELIVQKEDGKTYYLNSGEVTLHHE